MDISLNEQEFCSIARDFDIVSLSVDVSLDIFTPVEVASILLQDKPYGFLLESVDFSTMGTRYSFIGSDVTDVYEYRQDTLFKNGCQVGSGDPLLLLKGVMAGKRVYDDGGQYPFKCGLVGYFSYELARYFLPIKLTNHTDYPEALFMSSRVMVCFDHYDNKMRVSVLAECPNKDKDSIRAEYERASAEILGIFEKIRLGARHLRPIDLSERLLDRVKGIDALKFVSSSMKREEFIDGVQRIKGHIINGDIVQAVLSQQFSLESRASAFDCYRLLRLLNPSPYMFYIKAEPAGLNICGASPEMLVSAKGRQIETNPIAGTRRRGRDRDEDKALADDLLSDEKERAEHIMLVDLARNDLGIVAEPGSVEVRDLMHIEYYSHVMHMVTRVFGKLKHGNDMFDVLRAAFPAGTVSGAPKIRAMEIISEIEPVPRGIYAGAVGYFDYREIMDMCIAIRTILFYNDRAYVQAGAGIVYDSVPEKEFEETINKAKAQICAIKLTEGLLKLNS